MSVKHCIDNFINGNLSDARRQARRYSSRTLHDRLREDYNYSFDKAYFTVHYLKTGDGFQKACDCL